MNSKWHMHTLVTILAAGIVGPAVAEHVDAPQIRQVSAFARGSAEALSASRQEDGAKISATAIGVPDTRGVYRFVFVPAGAPGPLFPQDRLRQFGKTVERAGTDATVGIRRNTGEDSLATFTGSGQETFVVAETLDARDFVPVVRRGGVDVVGIDPFSDGRHIALEQLRINPNDFHGSITVRVSTASGRFDLRGTNGKSLPYSVKLAAVDACGGNTVVPDRKTGVPINGEGELNLCMELDTSGTAVPGGQYQSRLVVKLSDR